MYTLLLVDGCHYITADDANAVVRAVRERCESIEVTAHISAMRDERHTTRIVTRKVLKLIAHDVDDVQPPLYAVSISDFRSRRAGRNGSRIPFSAR